MIGGYFLKYLYVNLTTGQISDKIIPQSYAENFVGGPALGARLLWDLQPAGVDALGEKAHIGFVTGPLNGTTALFGGRYTVVCKSPVTGGFNDSNSGGFFGNELKKCGYDAIFVTGKAKEPVYLNVTDGKCEICDAKDIWGLDFVESEELLSAKLGKGYRFAGIGQAGEGLSYIAAVMNDGHRAAGRGGSGAVMGSKNLKMIALKGDVAVPVYDKEALAELNKETAKNLQSDGAKFFGSYGTTGLTVGNLVANDSGIKNWSAAFWDEYTDEEAEPFGGQYQDEKWRQKKYACGSCPLGCGALYEVNDGKYPVGHTARPEYETAASFGSMILNKDVEVLVKCNDLCNRYGLDTISAGAVIAWVMECYENGVLTKEQLDGIEATWGNGQAIISLTEKMGKSEGCGKILNLGSQKAADVFGRGHEYLVVAMGIEPGQHDPRFMPGLARTYKYEPTPGRHVKGTTGYANSSLPPEEKYVFDGTGEKDLACITGTEFDNAAGYCMFKYYGVWGDMGYKIYNAVTGFNMTQEDYDNFGKRSFAVRFAFNIREGIKKEDYTISPRLIGQPPMKKGNTAGRTIDVEKLGDNLFKTLNWNVDTITPTREFIDSVGGLDDIAKELGI